MINYYWFVTVLLIGAIMPATLQSKELQSLEAIAEGSNKFAIDLYQSLKDEPGNIIVSPISAQIVLTLAFNGANGTTAEEMAKVLHLPANRDQVLEGHKALITGLQDPVLQIATKMFIDKTFHVKPEFKAVADTYFLSGLEEKDFSGHPQEARKEINTWVEDKTNNKIKDLLPEDAVGSDTRTILVNAIHFKANWLYAFNKNITREAPFYVKPDQPILVPMMSIEKKFKYAQSEALGAKILEMPYVGNEFSMILLLPNKMDGLSEVEAKLSTINLGDELANLYETSVVVELPRFKIEATMLLKEKLQKLGMITAFTNAADFSGIANEPLKIDTVIQKAFIEVNEEGTEAAAATGIGIGLLSISTGPKTDFICDRPFLVYVVTKKTNLPLFISRVKSSKIF